MDTASLDRRPKRLAALIMALTVAGFAAAGCATKRYRAAPISPVETAQSLQSRSLSAPDLQAFIATNLGQPPRSPDAGWGLPELTLAALYFNPELQVARAGVVQAEAGVITAGARLNPSVKGNLGGETLPESPWIAGLGFSLPIETAGKRRHRLTAAERLADVARWNLAATAWKVRGLVRSALLESLAGERSLRLLQAQGGLRLQQVQLLEQRLSVGMISRPEVDTARIQYTQAVLAVRAGEGRLAQAKVSLAAAIGLPTAALNDLKMIWTEFDQPPPIESLKPAKIQEDAVLNRLDVRRALADYSASEAALQLEIARQYPDFNLGPDYAFEEGTHLFSVALDLTLPIFNRNQGPIAEAKARREQMAAQFLGVQASGIAESEQALTKYTAALNQLAQARQLIQQSVTQEQATQTSFQAGESDRVALNGAQLQTTVTEVAELDALVSAQQALGDLENAVQRPLLPGDIQTLSPLSPVLHPPARR